MSSEHSHDDHHHDHSLKPHIIVLLCLMGLTVLTYLTATYIHLPGFGNDALAMAIAFTKVGLVLFIFMHAREGSPLIKVCAVGGFFWVLLFFCYLIADVLTRPGVTWFEGW